MLYSISRDYEYSIHVVVNCLLYVYSGTTCGQEIKYLFIYLFTRLGRTYFVESQLFACFPYTDHFDFTVWHLEYTFSQIFLSNYVQICLTYRFQLILVTGTSNVKFGVLDNSSYVCDWLRSIINEC